MINKFIKLYIDSIQNEEEYIKSSKLFPFVAMSVFLQTMPYFVWSETKASDSLVFYRLFSILISVIIFLRPLSGYKYNASVFYTYVVAISFSLIISPYIAFFEFNNGNFWGMNLIFSLCAAFFIPTLFSQVHILVFSLTYIVIFHFTLDTHFLENKYSYISYGLSLLFFNVLVFSKNKQDLHNKMISNMKSIAAGIIHEIATPLSSLDIRIERLLKNPEKEELAPLIDRMRGILRFFSSKIFYDKVVLQQSEENIKNLVDESISSFPFQEFDQDLIDVDLQDAYDLVCDKEMMIQIFYNLIKNALYEIEKKRKGKINISTTIKSGEKILIFEDTVGSLKKENAKKIFFAFETTKKEGMGLGLSFIRESLKGQGFSISCEVEEQKHTRFTLKL